MKIKPAARAMPGDYMVSFVAASTQDREQMDLRVTVGARMGWGWVGVGWPGSRAYSCGWAGVSPMIVEARGLADTL